VRQLRGQTLFANSGFRKKKDARPFNASVGNRTVGESRRLQKGQTKQRNNGRGGRPSIPRRGRTSTGQIINVFNDFFGQGVKRVGFFRKKAFQARAGFQERLRGFAGFLAAGRLQAVVRQIEKSAEHAGGPLHDRGFLLERRHVVVRVQPDRRHEDVILVPCKIGRA